MNSSAGEALVVFVAAMALFQVFFEDVLVYLETAATGVPVPADRQLLLVVVPLVFTVLLFGVLLLMALRSSNIE